MALPYDYHMHTPLCHHASGEPVEYAQHAVNLGLKEIGFSEHAPMGTKDYDDWHMAYDKIDDYLGKLEKARTSFPQLSIKAGLEVDFLPGHEPWINGLANLHTWDYFIGSVHYITDAWDFDNPKKMDEWHARDPWDVWKEYFNRLTQAASSGLFQTIGHPDLCKKFAIIPDRDTSSLYLPFLEAVKENDLAIELNTAGNHKDCKEIYPHPDILKAAASMNIPLSFASDAHAPAEVGRDWDQAVSLAVKAGFTHFCQFNRRERSLIPLIG